MNEKVNLLRTTCPMYTQTMYFYVRFTRLPPRFTNTHPLHLTLRPSETLFNPTLSSEEESGVLVKGYWREVCIPPL